MRIFYYLSSSVDSSVSSSDDLLNLVHNLSLNTKGITEVTNFCLSSQDKGSGFGFVNSILLMVHSINS